MVHRKSLKPEFTKWSSQCVCVYGGRGGSLVRQSNGLNSSSAQIQNVANLGLNPGYLQATELGESNFSKPQVLIFKNVNNTRNMMNLGIYLTKDDQTVHEENYKILLIDILKAN